MKKYHYYKLFQSWHARCMAHDIEGTKAQHRAMEKQIFEKFVRDIIKSEVEKALRNAKK